MSLGKTYNSVAGKRTPRILKPYWLQNYADVPWYFALTQGIAARNPNSESRENLLFEGARRVQPTSLQLASRGRLLLNICSVANQKTLLQLDTHSIQTVTFLNLAKMPHFLLSLSEYLLRYSTTKSVPRHNYCNPTLEF